jgi:hypothetical protein
MIVQERKSKYKTKITISGNSANADRDMMQWCETNYGPGGRKNRWRSGWTGNDTTFYFKEKKDANWFTLRWS